MDGDKGPGSPMDRSDVDDRDDGTSSIASGDVRRGAGSGGGPSFDAREKKPVWRRKAIPMKPLDHYKRQLMGGASGDSREEDPETNKAQNGDIERHVRSAAAGTKGRHQEARRAVQSSSASAATRARARAQEVSHAEDRENSTRDHSGWRERAKGSKLASKTGGKQGGNRIPLITPIKSYEATSYSQRHAILRGGNDNDFDVEY